MAIDPAPSRLPASDDPTIGKLVVDATRDISTLVSKEIQLAKSELAVSVRAGGLGAGLLAAAAFLSTLGVIMLSFTIVYFIHWFGLGLHWSYLIVTGFWFLIVAVLALVGYKKVRQVGPPQKAIAQGKQIPGALKGSK